MRTIRDGLNGFLKVAIGHDNLKPNPAEQVDLLLDSPVLALLSSRCSTHDGRSSQLYEARFMERGLHGWQLFRPDQGDDKLHGTVLPISP
jgi:hypothetical protein